MSSLHKRPHKKAKDSHGISAESACEAVRTLLRYLGEDPDREGVVDTPHRFCRALLELNAGYSMDVEEILSTTFESESDEMVLLKDIPFSSLCEHHLLGFTGKAHVAYLPKDGRIVGLSKLARVVDVFSKRLQVQERMTQQIAKAIQEYLKPRGVAVVVQGMHSCMCVRGVQKEGAVMVTSSLLGAFRNSPVTRSEFMSLIS